MYRNLIVVILALFILTGCKNDNLQSHRLKNIQIDGHPEEWQDILIYSEKHNASFAVANDDSSLSICLITADPTLQTKLLRAGLVLWIEGDQKDVEPWGIKFPIGMPPNPSEMRRPQSAYSAQSEKERERKFEQALHSLSVLQGDQETNISIDIAKEKGIIADAAIHNGIFTYELSIPMDEMENHPFVIKSTEKVDLKFETLKIDFSTMQNKMADAQSRPGGRGGMAGGMGGGMSGGRGGRGSMGGGRSGGPGGMSGGQMDLDPVKIKIPVLLAK